MYDRSRSLLPGALVLAALLGAASPASSVALSTHVAPSSLATAGSGAPVERSSAPALATRRMVVVLRPDVAHAALAAFGGIRDPRHLAAVRAPALAALSARLGGAWFEPEFRNETPGASDRDLTTFWIAHLPPALGLADALDRARAAAEVVEAAPIALQPVDPVAGVPIAPGDARAGAPSFTAAAPNDTMFGLCYWQYQPSRRDLHTLEAWDLVQGDSTVIAIVDTGVLRDHPDLAGTTADDWGNLWTNRAERDGAPGVDDDGNGYVDDVWGWDFVDGDTLDYPARDGEDAVDEDDDPNDFAVHGTACAGIAAAIADNVHGLAGVAPHAKIMALRVGYSARANPAGLVDLSSAARAIVYAVRNGATVINCSFASVQQPDIIAAVDAATAAGVLVVAAGGNNGTPNYLGERDDVLSISSTDDKDKVTLFSNRQPYVDLCAPGQSIATTVLHATGTDSIGLRQATYSPGEAGTSFSAPMGAAAVALLDQYRRVQGLPKLTPYLTQLRITETVDDISALNPGTGYGTGRLNLFRMLTDPTRSTGFPARAPTIGPPVIVPSRGESRVAYATADSGLLVLGAVSGDTLVRAALPAAPTGGIAAADMGGALGPAMFVALANGKIAGFHVAGEPLDGWPVDATTTHGEFETMPALSDLDGDGILEVVWGGDDGNVWAWHADGTRVAGFPRRAGPGFRNLRVALGDLDGRPGAEIVVAANNDAVYAFAGDGTPLPGWPVTVSADPTSPVIFRLGTRATPAVAVAADTSLFVWGPGGGGWIWRKGLPAAVEQDIAVGDVLGGGSDQIVVLMRSQLGVYDSLGVQVAIRQLFVHPSWGPPLVASLSAGPGSNVMFASPDDQGRSVLYAFTSTLGDLRGWPKAGHPAKAPSMADVDGDGATEIAAGAGADHLAYLYDAGPGSWRPAAMDWPTPRANFARTGSRLDAPTLNAGDDVPPEAIADLSGDGGTTHAITLRWTAPADPGAGTVDRYEVRTSSSPIDVFHRGVPVPQAIAPAAPGSAESLHVAGLDESARHWFAVRSRDAVGNWSAWSNAYPFDAPTSDPAPIGDLRVTAATDSSLTLAWTASGDDGRVGRPARYLVRLATAPMDSAGFAHATKALDVPAAHDAGGTETFTVGALARGERWWIGLRAVDAAGNASPLSNQIAPTVGRLARIAGVALLPTRSPSPAPVQIEWQGDPASSGGRQTIDLYDVMGRRQAHFELPHEPSGVFAWDGHTTRGTLAGAGLYFARMRSGPFTVTGRIVLLR